MIVVRLTPAFRGPVWVSVRARPDTPTTMKRSSPLSILFKTMGLDNPLFIGRLQGLIKFVLGMKMRWIGTSMRCHLAARKIHCARQSRGYRVLSISVPSIKSIIGREENHKNVRGHLRLTQNRWTRSRREQLNFCAIFFRPGEEWPSLLTTSYTTLAKKKTHNFA